MNASSPSAPSGSPSPAGESTTAEIDESCRLPLLVLFISAAVWLIIGSLFGLIATIKFHGPGFLADQPWLTYGRVRPVFMNAMLYGFCIQAGLGVVLWIFARVGRVTVVQPLLVFFGATLWNLGVTAGVIGILAGENTGFENLEMPRYAALIVFIGYMLMAVWTILTLHRRRERRLIPSQWFALTALFWFPWIYSTANLLLTVFPVRGVTQAVIAWWYSGNLFTVWFGLVGLANAFYFIPKLSGRPLHSHYLALVTFWFLIFFGSWTGVPNSAPTPAWIPALSTVGTVLTLISIITVALNLYGTLGRVMPTAPGNVPLQFVLFGAAAFIVAGLLSILSAVVTVTNFTWFTTAVTQLNYYGFFTMIMFGAIYYIAPLLTGIELPYAKLTRLHLRLSIAGILLIFLPLAIGGILQGFKLQDPSVDFLRVSKSTLMFLRVSTIGDLLIAAGHVLFLMNVAGLAVRFQRARAKAAYAALTAEIKPAGVPS